MRGLIHCGVQDYIVDDDNGRLLSTVTLREHKYMRGLIHYVEYNDHGSLRTCKVARVL